MSERENSILSDLFHQCAWVAFAQAYTEGRHLECDYVKKLAYALYEEALAENG